MKKHIILALSMFATVCMSFFIWSMASASTWENLQTAANQSATTRRVVVQASGRSTPFINLEDGNQLTGDYEGPSEMVSILKQNAAEPRALASADFDEDGVPDLICAYTHSGGGLITLYRGNVDSIYQNSADAQKRKTEGTFTDSAFLSPARVFEVPVAVDFVGAGDFDADGHWDIVVAARDGKALWLLPGDGKGGFLDVGKIKLPGAITSLITGEINRPDGLTDVVVGVVAADGPEALVFEDPEGALQAEPEVFSLPGEATTLALGQLDDDYAIDLAIGAGSEVVTVHGRDRNLSLGAIRRAEASIALVDSRSVSFVIRSMVVGDFTGSNRTGLALLASDGTVYLTSTTRHETSQPARKKGTDAIVQEIGQWQGATHLVNVHVSTGPGDDLLILNNESHRLHILKTGRRVSSASVAAQTSSLDIDGEPLAVLPMRLNRDALSDLVTLRAHYIAPIVVKTAAATTFTVTNTSAFGPGSLTQAILDANANIGSDLIVFNIPGPGVHFIIRPTSFPTIIDPVTIDGTTQPGFNGTPVVFLAGNVNIPGGDDGLSISAGATTVRALGFVLFAHDGIELTTMGHNVIEGNFIGAGGLQAFEFVPRNLDNGIRVLSSDNTIGGTNVSARNVISNNRNSGIFIGGDSNPSRNIVHGNSIGTAPVDGINPGLRIQGAGVLILSGASNIIGGTTAGARNVISGNVATGISILSATSIGTLVQGNLVGTDATGTLSFSNTTGIQAFAPISTVGGTTPAARNVISGNEGPGVSVSSNNVVQGNYIGTNVNGTGALGNGEDGILIRDGSDNSIGGTVGAGNVIAFNKGNGVNVVADSGLFARRNSIRGNKIFSNTALGIDLFPPGVTANDPCDSDSGPNDLQNFPVLSLASSSSISATIQGSLNSTANSTFTIEFFSNATCDPSGFGEGQTLIGSATVSTDNSCNATFKITLPIAVSLGQFITATATDSAGNTSEFSQCIQVQSGTVFDLCLQDESNGGILILNSTTGEYQYTDCGGTIIGGIGSLTKRGCAIALQVNGPDRRVSASIDTCTKKGTASIQVQSQGRTFTIIDRNTSNNSCACEGPG